MTKGLIHIYCGDGKGKTTASIGLAARAAGRGMRVLYVQFFKDGHSSEFKALEKVENITFLPPERNFGFFWTLSPEEKEEAKTFYTAHLREAIRRSAGCDLLVLDESMSACTTGVIEEAELLRFLREKPEALEVVLTGRNPSQALCDAADYITEMCKRKHPFDQGIPARPGIEF